ncbi:hypothetical protein GCM10014715_22750 [Streptomyces spiralis]|uniref:Uncharacterized protein n=1 Tax=Streptomyces spiralis TaxID=66376 RepID=A0A918ZTX9_9ACTN|nr:hypothetical protein GCM10014715_22750 [Streptomyces spiralis]
MWPGKPAGARNGRPNGPALPPAPGPPPGCAARTDRLRSQVGTGKLYQPTATSSHWGALWEMKEDWPATSSYGKP